MFWNQPTAWVVVGIALLVLLALALIEFLGRPPAPAASAAAPSEPPSESRPPAPHS